LLNNFLSLTSSHSFFLELIEKLESNESSSFYLFKILRAHILPLTNCAFNKSGDKFITGSYDRTCKVWNTLTGDEILTLEGHRNVVYAIAFNNPYGDKIITGSFGKIDIPFLFFFLLISLFSSSCR
jgi:dynein assembly factor with WDR repeat domains 1